MRKFRFRNSSLISAVSVALVLCIVGMECVLLLSAGALVTRMREGMTINAELAQDADSVQCARLDSVLSAKDRFLSYTYISAEQALEVEINELGENPEEFLGYNPLRASYEIHPTEAYSSPDSMAVLAAQLEADSAITYVHYTRDLVDVVSKNVQRATLILFIVALVLLLVSMVLIVNTIRLQIYAKRFLINTMTLVGATSWVTRRPFVLRSMLIGLISGMVALGIIAGALYYVKFTFGMWLFPLTYINIGFVAVVVLGSGLLITLFAALIATGRYIRMDNNTLYEI